MKHVFGTGKVPPHAGFGIAHRVASPAGVRSRPGVELTQNTP